MRRAFLLAPCLIAGCGRIGFDPQTVVEIPGFSCERPRVTTRPVVTDGSANTVALTATALTLGIAYAVPSRAQVVLVETTPAGGRLRGPFASVGSAELGYNREPAVAWNGRELVVFRSLSNRGTSAGPVVLTRFLADGTAVDTTISPLTEGGSSVALASDGAGFGAVWVGFGGAENGVWFAPIGADGTRTAMGDGVKGGTDCLCVPQVVWADGEWIVVFADSNVPGALYNGIELARMSTAGTGLAPHTLLSEPEGTGSHPRFVSSGSAFGVLWTRGFSGASSIGVGRVDRGGQRTSLGILDVKPLDADLATLGTGHVAAISDGSGLALWPLDGDLLPAGDPATIVPLPDIDGVKVVEIAGGLSIAWTREGNVSVTRVACD